MIRELVAETLIGWAYDVLPDGPEKIQMAKFIATSWISDVLRTSYRATCFKCRWVGPVVYSLPQRHQVCPLCGYQPLLYDEQKGRS